MLGRFIVCFALFVGVCVWFGTARHTDVAENVFSSGIYADYSAQLKQFVDLHPLTARSAFWSPTRFNKKIQDLLAHIGRPLEKGKERLWHETLILELRGLCQDSVHQSQTIHESHQLLEDLVTWLYLEVDLTPSFESFLYASVPHPTCDFPQYLRDTYLLLHDNQRFNKIQAQPSFDDPLLWGNLPTCYTSISHPALIRMGEPITYNCSLFQSCPTVCPLFYQFVQQQPSHLYVNLMKREGSERASTLLIEQLEKEVGGLYVMTLDKDSLFYRQQESHFPDSVDLADFKEEFLHHLWKHRGDYHWPRVLNRSKWRTELEGLIRTVHLKHFTCHRSLNRQERQVFIELTYLAIIDALVEKWHPVSMNISCLQGIDRGPSLLVLWMWKHQLAGAEQLAAQLLAPPLVFHNRSSHRSRINRFASCAEKIRKSRRGLHA